jgi:hypothetical protein
VRCGVLPEAGEGAEVTEHVAVVSFIYGGTGTQEAGDSIRRKVGDRREESLH